MPKPHRHVLRLLVAAMIPALLPAIATAAPMNASTADVAAAADTYPKPNSDPVLCPVDELVVPESSRGVVTEWLSFGESVSVEPLADRIWAGVWATGDNGPEGWAGTSAPSDYPLPGAPHYSLIARIGNGPYQYVGNTNTSFKNTKPGFRQRVVFRTNDNRPGNGSGAFKVFVHYGCH